MYEFIMKSFVGLAISLSVMGGTYSLGKVGKSAMEAIARQPESADKLFTPLITVCALIEGAVVLGLGVAYLLLS